MKKEKQKFYQRLRKEAHTILDKILDANELIEISEGKDERVRAAFSAAMYFEELNQNFLTITSEVKRHLIPIDENFSSTIEQWRNGVARMIGDQIPLDPYDRDTIRRALRGLNHGEVQFSVSPTNTGKKNKAWTLSCMQFLGVVHVYALRGSGLQAKAARQKVAKAYGYHTEGGSETIRTWENRELQKYFSENSISNWKKSARALGKMGLKFETEDSVDLEILETLIHSDGKENFFLSGKADILKHYSIEECGILYKLAQRDVDIKIPIIF